MKKLTILLALFCVATFAQEKGSFTDNRDGKKYKTTKIGNQIWMAENLNYEIEESKCYDNKASNCDKYGKLYNWNIAMKACPNGWRLPTNGDWDKLYRFADGTSGTDSPYNSKTAGRYLKATNGWSKNGNGEDSFGFTALPGGYSEFGYFIDVGYRSIWWSASEIDSGFTYGRGMLYNNESAGSGSDNNSFLFSVRCVNDNSKEDLEKIADREIKNKMLEEESKVIAQEQDLQELGNKKDFQELGNKNKIRKEKKFETSRRKTSIDNISSFAQEKESFTDKRDGKTYKTVKIGNNVWMAENLNYEAKSSKCYDNKNANCIKYGRLYDWNTAKNVCPYGWHLARNYEWDNLFRFSDGSGGTSRLYNSETAGKHLKAKFGWSENGNGLDTYGFTALPSGIGGTNHKGYASLSIGVVGVWWSYDGFTNNKYARCMVNSEDYAHNNNDVAKLPNALFSVRCVQDVRQ